MRRDAGVWGKEVDVLFDELLGARPLYKLAGRGGQSFRPGKL